MNLKDQKIDLLFMFSVPAPYVVARLTALEATEKFNIYVIFISNKSTTYSWEMSTNLPNLQAKFIERGKKVNQFSNFFYICKLFLEIYNIPAKNVFIAGYASGFSLFTILFSKILHKKLYLMSASSEQDYDRIWIKEFIKKIVLRLFSGAIVGGGRQKKYLISLGFNESNIALGYNVVDQNFFSNTKAIESKTDLDYLPQKFFLVVARLVEKKNIANILLAYKIYFAKSKDRFPLIITGDGPLLDKLIELAEYLKIKDSVFFLGFLQQNNLRNFYKNAVCLILFSKSEQWGLVVNEAIASNLKVIVSDACGCAESLVEHGVNGFIVDQDSYVSLAKYMLLIDNNFLDETRSKQISIVTDAIYQTDLFCQGIEYLLYSNSN
jgi:glycosyltransferase involved in cell wall biosynthesis